MDHHCCLAGILGQLDEHTEPEDESAVEDLLIFEVDDFPFDPRTVDLQPPDDLGRRVIRGWILPPEAADVPHRERDADDGTGPGGVGMDPQRGRMIGRADDSLRVECPSVVSQAGSRSALKFQPRLHLQVDR